MSILSTLAWRNIWRNRRRTILTSLAIALATGILVFFMALQFSMYAASIKGTVSTFQGHIQVQKIGFLDKPQIQSSFANGDSLQREISNIIGISTVAQRAQAFALASSDDRTYGVQIIGVEPKNEKTVSTIPSLIKQGNYLKGLEESEAVIGLSLARNLKIKLGDDLTILGQGKDGSLAAASVKVIGFFESGVQDLDRSLIEMPLKAFQEVFSMNNEIHALVVVTDNLDEIDNKRLKIDEIINQRNLKSQIVALTWDQILPGIKQAIEFDLTFGWMFYLSLILVVVLSILNTFLMSILERTREFGLLLALGMKSTSVARLVLRECVFLTIIGIVFGVLLGSATIWYYHVNGFYLPGSEEIMKLWNIPVMAKPDFSLAALLIGPSVIIITTLLALLYPVLKLMQVEPVEAMRST